MSFTMSPCQHFLTFLDVKNTLDFCHKCCGPGVFPSEKGILWYGCYKKFLSPLWSVVTSLITRDCYVHAGLETARHGRGLRNWVVERGEEWYFGHVGWESWPLGEWSVVYSEFCVLIL